MDEHCFTLRITAKNQQCFFDRASRYTRVKKTNLMHNLFLVYFVNLYVFRADLDPIIRRYNSMYTTIGTYYSF